MFGEPSSLTATIHVRFHYKEPEKKAVTEADVARLSRILEQANDLDPDMMGILFKFASYLEELAVK